MFSFFFFIAIGNSSCSSDILKYLYNSNAFPISSILSLARKLESSYRNEIKQYLEPTHNLQTYVIYLLSPLYSPSLNPLNHLVSFLPLFSKEWNIEGYHSIEYSKQDEISKCNQPLPPSGPSSIQIFQSIISTESLQSLLHSNYLLLLLLLLCLYERYNRDQTTKSWVKTK